MKKYFLTALVLVFILASCKDDPKKSTNETETAEKTGIDLTTAAPKEEEAEKGPKVLRGEFIFVDSAAVLKGEGFIYGVEINAMAKKLAQQTDSLKRNEFDMVPVIIKGEVKPNSGEGWEEVVSIKEIVKVSEPISDPAIRVDGEGTK